MVAREAERRISRARFNNDPFDLNGNDSVKARYRVRDRRRLLATHSNNRGGTLKNARANEYDRSYGRTRAINKRPDRRNYVAD